MNNIINTVKGNIAVIRDFKIYWAAPEGIYLYIPSENDIVKLRLFDSKGETIIEKECKTENNVTVVEFPEGLPLGYHDYELNLYMNKNTLPRTVMSGKIHVSLYVERR